MAFGSKSNIAGGVNGSPFVPNHGQRNRRPSGWGGKNMLHGNGSDPSNILTTYGSVLPELEEGLDDMDAVEVELDAIGFARGPSSQMMRAESDDGQRADSLMAEGSPAPAYEFSHIPPGGSAAEIDQPLSSLSTLGSGISIEVETTMSTNV